MFWRPASAGRLQRRNKAGRSAYGRAECLQHIDEAGKAGGDRAGVVDGHRRAGVEAEHGEAHRDAVIEAGGDGGTAGDGLAAAALDDQAVGQFLAGDAAGDKARSP